MTATCHQLPPSVVQELLQVAARAICDRPGESAAQRDSRTSQMVHMVLSMQPRDGLEYILSILAVGHFNLILHSMRDAFQSPPETQNSPAQSTVVALDRALQGCAKELRLSRKRPSTDQTAERRPKGVTTSEAETNASVAPATAAKAPSIPAEAQTVPPSKTDVPAKPSASQLREQVAALLQATGQHAPLKTPSAATDAKPAQTRAGAPQYGALDEALAELAGTTESLPARNAVSALK
jgi:hypothetical protein